MSSSLPLTLPTCPNNEYTLGTELGFLKERHLSWERPPGRMTPLGTESVCKGKYSSPGWMPVLRGASGRTHPLF
jgi:hypothetical protein